jgi:hypothetical protein
MEFVEGRPLNLILGPTAQVPLDNLLDIGVQVAQALDFAHKNGVVHRDIKPHNILVTPDGHAKIADFGIARLEGTELTQEGTSLGTPSYMSPEQFRGGAIDGRSDIFSLGAVLYWMCTGKKPFPGDTVTIASFQVAYENPIPPTQAKTDLPKDLDEIISRCLAKNPSKRYATCGDLAADLDAVRGGRPLPTHLGMEPERTEPFPLPSRKEAQRADPTEANAETRVAASPSQEGAPFLASASAPQRGGRSWMAGAAVALVALFLVMLVVTKWLAQRSLENQPAPAAATSPAPDAGATVAAQDSSGAEKSPSASGTAGGTPKPAPAAKASAAKPVVVVNFEVYCKHPFKQATLEIYDGKRIFLNEQLEGKRRGITLGISTSGEFDKKDVSLPSGEHTFHVRVIPKEGTPVWEDKVTGVLAQRIHTRLEITFKNSDTDPGGRKLVLAVKHPD